MLKLSLTLLAIKQRLKLNYKEKPNRLETTKVPQSSGQYILSKKRFHL